MNLIHFHGLNCYLNCIVSIAASFGLKYEAAFATLWSETDFSHDPDHNIYSTKRMLANLEAMGMGLKSIAHVPAGSEKASLHPLRAEGFIIVEMDAFDIPWSPIYQAIHSPHYFFAQEEKPGFFFCFDPTYNEKYRPLSRGDIISRSSEIYLVESTIQRPLQTDILNQAQEIISVHPQTRQRLLFEIKNCAGQNQKNAVSLGRYSDALINNRYLYNHYLRATGFSSCRMPFDKDLFLRWEAVKNGLYKASIVKNNQSVIDEVCDLFDRLMAEEITIAKQIISAVA